MSPHETEPARHGNPRHKTVNHEDQFGRNAIGLAWRG